MITAGEARTARGLKAKSVLVGKGSRVRGPIVAEQVQIGSQMDFGSIWGLPWWRGTLGRMAAVEDVYGGEVKVENHSRAKRIFGEKVVLEEGSMADQVIYTKEVKLPLHKRYFLEKPPMKTEKLPDSPI